MWSRKIIFKMAGVALCCLSLTGCFGSKKKSNKAAPLYETHNMHDVYKESEKDNAFLEESKNQVVAYFQLNSARLDVHAQESLNNVVKHCTKNPHSNIVLNGHTDATGPDDFNEQLSQMRADSVKTYLMSQAIESDRIDTYGHSNRQLLAIGNSEKAHAKNRRVEVKLLS